MKIRLLYQCIYFLVTTIIHASFGQQFNPSILQDSRLEPKVDGTFGFMYRTENGIAHAAKGDPNGHIQGRFSYTDPTGLKVNINYNTGSHVTPGYNYNAQSTAPRSVPAPLPKYQPQEQDEYYDDNNNMYEPLPPLPPQRPYNPPSRRKEPVYRPPSSYEVPYQNQRRTRPATPPPVPSRNNDLYDDYNTDEYYDRPNDRNSNLLCLGGGW